MTPADPSRRIAAPVIAGNWKMNNGPSETRDFFDAFLELYGAGQERTVIFFPPTLSFASAANAVTARGDIGLGVQNIYWQKAGAFTGEISAAMAAEAGAHYTLAGHSERRQLFHESDDDVGRKAAAAIEAGVTPVICVGETLAQREAGALEAVLARQLDAALRPIDRQPGFLLAYEPVWAIGTGVNATPGDASAAHTFLRDHLARSIGLDAAAETRILYGGSVKPDNAAELLAAPGVDGVLVGGASLDPSGFARIAAAVPLSPHERRGSG